MYIVHSTTRRVYVTDLMIMTGLFMVCNWTVIVLGNILSSFNRLAKVQINSINLALTKPKL